jgi:hypothetical protein
MMSFSFGRSLLFMAVSALLLLSMQNCSKTPFVARNLEDLGLFNNQDCIASPSADACIWQKNASASVASFNGNLRDYSNSQIHGVKLQHLTDAKYLKGQYIEVIPSQSPAVEKSAQNFRIPFLAQNPMEFAQVNSYYWADMTYDFVLQNVEASKFSNYIIKVVPDSAMAGWSPSTGEVHLKTDPDRGRHMALDGGIISYYTALALISHLNGKQETSSNRQMNYCITSSGTYLSISCCQSSLGCSQAIRSGQADILVALNFPQHPGLGEDWSLNADGIEQCGITRNPSLNPKLTSGQAFDACASQQVRGHYAVMGAVYAAIWWDLKSKLTPDQFKKLFFAHLEITKADDDFSSIRTKLLDLEQQHYSGELAGIINGAFDGRITPP